jgi:hypothetical protein
MISHGLFHFSTSPFQPYIMSPNLSLTIYTILSSYCLAGCLIEYFAVFPGWLLVSPADIAVVHMREEKDKGLVRTLIMTGWIRVLSMVAHFGAVT